MVATNFAPALKCVLVHEGGLDDDPNDPGGRTAYGIIQRRYNQYRRAKGLPVQDVWKISTSERTEIYDVYYWRVIRGDKLPAGLDYAVFDACVNSGEAQAGKWLQRAINDQRAKSGEAPIAVDGRIGDGTLQAVDEIDDVDAVIGFMQQRRLAMLRELRTWRYFGKGWSRRVAEVKKLAQAIADGSVPAPMPAGWVTAPATKVSGKALPSDAKPLPSPDKGVVSSAIGTVSSGASTVTTTLAPAQGMSPTIDLVLQVLLVVGIILGLAGAAWAWWANREAKRMAAALDIGPPPAAGNDNAPPAEAEAA
ncbi:glycoside hydrolase family 108 protein [Xanthobacter versatilis]|uniref:glycoside hydrolase family 108 protein n=1 Tax=Xanthobacter autotrophicus (strain ATCC BAA-1158 / Py2) TaxID=78245 RepID=UPI00372A26DF